MSVQNTSGPWYIVCTWGADGQLLVYSSNMGYSPHLPNEAQHDIHGAWVVPIAPWGGSDTP